MGSGGISITSSNNGVTWSVSDTLNGQFLGVAYGNNTYVAVNEQNCIYSSSYNGTTWLQLETTTNFLDASFGNNNNFVVVGAN